MRNTILICGAVLVLLALPATAQKASTVPETHCDPSFATDIAANFPSQSNGAFINIPGDCTATAGCDDFFDVDCAGGETLTMSFCSNGGTASFDTGLARFEAGVETGCNDDTCALLSELSVAAAAGLNRVRVGGFGGDSGTYTLAFQAPSSCSVVGAVPVALQTFDVE